MMLTALALPAAATAQVGAPADSTGGAFQSSALEDLAVRFGARGEFGGDWSLFRPCDASFQVSCEPGLIPQLQPQVEFGLQARGSIADRLFVDVDYDQTREFAGANRFQLYYQGQEGEVLQRLEVGDVSFALPETRFLTRGIPVGNFGVLARAQVGSAEVQGVFAQQQGERRTREFQLGGLASPGVIYRDTLVVDDADYVQGQFFFLVDPERIDDAPHIDVLTLRPGDAPSSVAPGSAPVQLYRMERDPVRRQQVEGYILADAELSRNGETTRESGWFRHLRPDEDYVLHSSGLWVTLRTPLRPDEALAVTYLAQSGARVGDYNPEVVYNAGGTPTLRLLRATQAQHQPGRATWDLEMKQIYRVSGSSEVDPYTVDVSISLGEESGGRTFRTVPGREPLSFLRLFGIDAQSPGERVDRTAIFQPDDGLVDDSPIPGTFLIFPTLRPFLEPAGLPSEGLGADEIAALLGPDVNERIYLASDPLERVTGALYRLNLSAEIRSVGVGAVFALGSFGMREGSERIYLGDALLQPFVDYIIDPQAGIVTLLRPEILVARATSDVLRVSWEEPGLFQIAPTSLFGVSAHLPFAEVGGLDLIGLYQLQRELVSRPRFGAEPPGLGMLGARATADLDVPAVDRALRGVFGDAVGVGVARMSLEAEVALALPDPNRSGDAFLDDFDAGDERTLSLLSNSWFLGSAPEQIEGAEDVLPPVLDVQSAASLAWQHTWVARGTAGDSLGIFDGFLPQEIDRQINVAGTQTREPGMRLSFGDPSGGGDGDVAWRSITTLLSPTGLDLTYSEFLDFYVADGEAVTLVFDLGLVSEDAFFFDETGSTFGVRPDTGRPWGLGQLDQEADPLLGEIWERTADERGVWPEDCLADPGRIYDLGSPEANCTRGNGRRDTEDLNGNQVLDTADRTVRYVVRLDGNSPYLTRDRQATGTQFRLYRIPLRGPLATAPSGLFSEADWRAVQALRVTVVGPRGSSLTLARMRLVGSRWVKRGVQGVLTGIGGDTLSIGGEFEVTPVSVLTEGSDYQAPPGVLGEIDDPNAALSGRGVEFNEKSLGLRFRAIQPDDRVEVYNRFLQRPRNFLAYGEMRVWTVARSGTWDDTAPAEFFVKIGTDDDNFYLYRSPLETVEGGGVTTADWLPERVVRFGEWLELRERAEQELASVDRPPGAPPVMVWSADSTYAVVLNDRARAPNLAAVREISMGVLNSSDQTVDGEVWVNELRLGGAIRSPGGAGFASVEFAGGELIQARLDYGGEGARFRELGELPNYRGDNELSFSGTVDVGSFAPGEWGWDVPVSVVHRRRGQDPLYLEGTDLRASGLAGARTNAFAETRVTVAFQPTGTTGNRLADLALGGLDARISFSRSNGTSLTTEDRTRGTAGTIGYTWQPQPRTIPLLPGFTEEVVRILLPGILFERLRDTRLRWNPEIVSLRAGITRRTFVIERFDQVFHDPASEPAGTGRAPESWLENSARIGLRPFGGLGLALDMITRRDLLDPAEGVRDPRVREAVERERSRMLGTDLGWETRREVVGRLTFQPRLPAWLNANLGVQTRYLGERDPGLVTFSADSIPELLRTSGGRRDLSGTFTIDPALALDALLGGDSETRGGAGGLVTTVVGAFSPLTLSTQDGITARFDREAIDPGAGFQFGFGGSGAFEEVDDVRATTLVDRSGLSAGSGLRLPATLFVNLNYRTTRLRSVDRRSVRNAQTDTWPDLRLGFTDLPVPAAWRDDLPQVSLSVGFREDTRDLRFGIGVTQRRLNVDRTLPLEFALAWPSGVVARYRGQRTRGEGGDPTGLTERELEEHGFSVETRLTPRGRLADRIEAPLRFSFLVEFGRNSECRVTTGQSACVDFIDQLDRGASFALDGLVSGAEVGVQVGLVDRRSFTDLRSGFTQFRLGVWGRMLLEAGPVERLGQVLSPF